MHIWSAYEVLGKKLQAARPERRPKIAIFYKKISKFKMGIFGKKMNFPDQKKRNFGLGQKIEKIVCFFTWILINFFFIRELFRLICFFWSFYQKFNPLFGYLFSKNKFGIGPAKINLRKKHKVKKKQNGFWCHF